MESDRDVFEHESSAKRQKLDFGPSKLGELCDGRNFPTFSNIQLGPIDSAEGISADCDSGYEASTLESIPTSSHHTSPQTESGDVPDNLSSLSETLLTPSRTDQTEISQDSTEIDDDNASTVSEISGLSDLSGLDWKPMAGSMRWIQKQMHNGVNPRELLEDLGVDLKEVPQYVEEVTLWKLIINMLAEPPRRNKLRHINTLDDVIRLVKGAKNIIVLTGAGVSVSCGIPDFRSRDGIYARLAKDFPDLPDPQAMFDINYFSQDPRPFFKFARDIYPGKFQPSPCHRFIKLMEKNGKLLRNYTQNIDTLEKEADIQRVIECHGSFATATCTKCSHKVTADAIREIVLAQRIPLCEKCHPEQTWVPSVDDKQGTSEAIDYRQLVSYGIMKPDIVFFGEGLPDTFHEAMSEDKKHCDLLLVIGSSLKVRPVALIPSSLPAHVPQILINREPLPHCHFDVELLGDCDVIINYLCHLFGGIWKAGIVEETLLEQTPHLSPLDVLSFGEKHDSNPSKVSSSQGEAILNRTEEYCTSTKCSSSLTPKSEVDTSYVNYEEQRSIITKQTLLDNDSVACIDLKTIKERHMSIDSTRDSGIEENSNLTDVEKNEDETSNENHESQYTIQSSDHGRNSEEINLNDESQTVDLKGFWQPKIKKSLADCLPTNSFYHIKPNRYIFPGAEVTYDPDERFPFNDSSSTSSNSDSESDTEQFVER